MGPLSEPYLSCVSFAVTSHAVASSAGQYTPRSTRLSTIPPVPYSPQPPHGTLSVSHISAGVTHYTAPFDN